ncbi:CYTH domain-containing protein [Phormidium sp. CCY1219]|uniref:CYTH domain-containing protein n=1 Tax=Phormidium sp. CCY1219 TaxID=2886104 RepID=UPI002D1EABFB|nr:CYTH domain-containing protein [Phormidium sp. CCY1219]MEB3826919.1 CYTH domain-containing protein [Phormidium sp. CCY1219]
MATEIERKFLVKNESWRSLAIGTVYRQGYIVANAQQSVRVRIIGQEAYLTIKGATVGRTRAEFEYPIPLEDARQMLETLCQPPFIEKKRYKVNWGELVWEIDEFDGDNKGLIVAEVELVDENQVIELPEWVGEEVSHDPRFYNVNLIHHPYCRWSEADKQWVCQKVASSVPTGNS